MESEHEQNFEKFSQSFKCKCATTLLKPTTTTTTKIHLLYNCVYDTNEYLVYCKPEFR